MLISDVVDNGTWMSCSPHPTTTRRNVTLSQSQSSDRIGRVLSVVGPLWGLYWMVVVPPVHRWSIKHHQSLFIELF